MRRQYKKIVWSVGVLEKAILRWRLKRKGFRGLHVETGELVADQTTQEGETEEDFFRIGRRQAEERIEQSVVRVQAMFRSKKAQEDYRRMKLAHNEAKVSSIYLKECENLPHWPTNCRSLTLQFIPEYDNLKVTITREKCENKKNSIGYCNTVILYT